MQPLRRIVRDFFFFFLAFRCCTNTSSLFFRRGFWIGFVLFLGLSSTKLLHCCILLVMTELTAVMAATSTMTLESRVKRHPPSSSNGFPASSEETPSGLTVYPGGFLRRCRLASPTAPPFPFTIALHCSCAWSWAMAEKGRHVFCKTNPPFPPS